MLPDGIDQKILIALERISQAIRILAWKTGKSLHLNPIQIQILIFLLQHSEENNKVSTLAKEFNITKASISDTVRALEDKNLIDKVSTTGDLRNFRIRLTAAGKNIAKKAMLYVTDVSSSIQKLPPEEKDKLFSILGKIILDLHAGGVIPVQRMCQTCSYHAIRNVQHHCQLLNCNLTTDRLQLDCADHKIKP